MKKFIFAAIAFVSLGFASCEKDGPGQTETQAMSGEWIITFTDGTDSHEADHALTFNTSANLPDEIWVNDEGALLNGFQAKVKCDQTSMTFASDGWVDNVADEGKVRITNGKITLNGDKLPSGRIVDTISYDIEFDDDPTVWHAKGYRRTGFVEDRGFYY